MSKRRFLEFLGFGGKKPPEPSRYKSLPVWGDGTYDLGDGIVMGVDVAVFSPMDKTVITVMKKNPDGSVQIMDGRELNKDGSLSEIELYDQINAIAYYYRDHKNLNNNEDSI